MATVSLASLTALILYLYVGYPLILWFLASLFPHKHRQDDRYEPSVTLIISCRNEEGVIKAKLENSLALDYPPGKLKILVVSDSSTDSTEEIVRACTDNRVILHRQEQRRGKTAALNAAMAGVTSDIVVFSDANAMYDRSALRRLVRHFVDDCVGYVVGHARYISTSETAAGSSEGMYWDFEVKVKMWESAFSSVVGGDGAIYAIRRHLYEELEETDINDFVNPLQIVEKGYRGLFDPEAWCTEKPAGDFQKEFGRKVRITNRSFNGVLRVPGSCNPFKVGWFAWQLVSHKLLRWFSPFIVAAHFAVTMSADWTPPAGYLALFSTLCYFALALLALIGWWKDRSKKGEALFSVPYYFMLMNVALTTGIVIRLKGEIISVWDTVRDESSFRSRVVPHMPFILSTMVIVCIGRLFQWLGIGLLVLHLTSAALFLVLLYTYLGYPLVVAVLARLRPVTTRSDDGFTPPVTLLVAAYNEEKHIEDKLLNSLGVDYPGECLRIIVASDGSTDGTNRIVGRYAARGIELCDYPTNRGKIAVLNETMKKVDSEIVVFSDANTMYHPQAIRKLVRHFIDPRVGAVSGKVTLSNGTVSYAVAENSYYGIEHFIQEQEGRSGTVIGADGAMYAIRRCLYSPPPDDTILDDFVIVMRIAREGHLVLHEREALGYEQNLHEVGAEFRRKARIIAGGIQCLLSGDALPRRSQKALWFKFLSHKVLRWFSGLLSLLLVILLIEMSRSEGNILTYGLIIISAIAAVGHLVPATRRILPVSLLHYLFMLKLAAMVGCYLGLTGRQKVTWRRS